MRTARTIASSILVAAIAASLVAITVPAMAQPPGGKGKGKDKDKGGLDLKAGPNDVAKELQESLEKLRAEMIEIELKLKKAKTEPGKPAGPQFGGGGFGPDGKGGFGGFSPGGKGGPGGFGPGGKGGPGFGPGGMGGLAGFGPPAGALEKMSAPELKDLISKLQKVLEEKIKAEKGNDQKPQADKKPVKPTGEKPGASGQEAILQRLDKLTKEIDEIRKSIKK